MTLIMALFPLTLLCLSLDSHGDENKSHDWDWALISSGFMASQIAITTGSHSVGYIDFDCDLSDYKKTITSEVELASIHRVVTADFPKGVLVVSC